MEGVKGEKERGRWTEGEREREKKEGREGKGGREGERESTLGSVQGIPPGIPPPPQLTCCGFE